MPSVPTFISPLKWRDGALPMLDIVNWLESIAIPVLPAKSTALMWKFPSARSNGKPLPSVWSKGCTAKLESDLIKKESVEINRNWHLMWSTFYFHKKHYGYLSAMIKIFPKLSSSLIKFIFFLISFQKYKSEIYKHRLLGIINSVLLRKSWYRPKLKMYNN